MAGIYDVGALRKAAEANGFKGTDEELILETARLNKRDPADLARYLGYDLGGKWGNRASASIDSYQANMYGLGEAVTGADWFRSGRRENEAAAELQRGIARSQGAISSYKDVAGVGDALDYVGGLAVDSMPYALEALGGGIGAARLAGRGLQATINAGRAADAGLDAVRAGQVAERAMALRSTAGGVAASYPSAVGDILSNQREASADGQTMDLGMAALGGIPYAALNAFGVEGALARRSLARGIGEGSGLRRLGRSVGLGAVTEGASETGQEVINQGFGRMATNPNATLTDPAALERYGESFIGGAALGGVFSGAGGWRRSQEYVDSERLQAAGERERLAALRAAEVAEQKRSLDLLGGHTSPDWGLTSGFDPQPAAPLDPRLVTDPRLGDLSPGWSTEPGAAPYAPATGIPATGMYTPLDEAPPTTGRRRDTTGTQVPVVDGVPTALGNIVADQYGQAATTQQQADSLYGRDNGDPGLIEARRRYEETLRAQEEAKRQQAEAQAKYVAKREDAFTTFGATTPEDQKRVKQPAIDALALLRTLDPADPSVNSMIGELTAAVQAGDIPSVNRLLKEARDYASQQPVVPGAAGVTDGAVAGQGDKSARGAGAARPVAGGGVAGAATGPVVADANGGADQVVAGAQGVDAARGKSGALTLTDRLEQSGIDMDAPIEVKTGGGKVVTKSRRELVDSMVNADPADTIIIGALMARSTGRNLTLDQIGVLVARTLGLKKPLTKQAVEKRMAKFGLTEDAVNAATGSGMNSASQEELGGDLSESGFRAADGIGDATSDGIVDDGATAGERKLAAQGSKLLKAAEGSKLDRDNAAVDEALRPAMTAEERELAQVRAAVEVDRALQEDMRDENLAQYAFEAGKDWEEGRSDDGPNWDDLTPFVRYAFTMDHRELVNSDADWNQFEALVREYEKDLSSGLLENTPTQAAIDRLQSTSRGDGSDEATRVGADRRGQIAGEVRAAPAGAIGYDGAVEDAVEVREVKAALPRPNVSATPGATMGTAIEAEAGPRTSAAALPKPAPKAAAPAPAPKAPLPRPNVSSTPGATIGAPGIVAPAGPAFTATDLGLKLNETPVSAPEAEVVDAAVETLSAPQVELLEREFAAPAATPEFRRKLIDALIAFAEGGARAVKAALRHVLSKVYAAVIAGTAVFTPSGLSSVAEFQYLPSTELAQSPKALPAVPAELRAKMSPAAQTAYRHMMAAVRPGAEKANKLMVLVDKPTARMFIFNPDGSPLLDRKVLVGAALGDLYKGNTDVKANRVTPAGLFTLGLRDAARGGSEARTAGEYDFGKVFVLDKAIDGEYSVTLFHSVWTKEKDAPQRLGALATDDPANSRYSFGCVNVDKATYERLLKDHLDQMDGASMFVVPDNQEQVMDFITGKTAKSKGDVDGLTRKEMKFSKAGNDEVGREEALKRLYRKAREAYDEFDSPSGAYDALYEAANPAEKSILRALKKDDFLGFDYPHQAFREILNEMRAPNFFTEDTGGNYDISPQLKAAVSRLGNKFGTPGFSKAAAGGSTVASVNAELRKLKLATNGRVQVVQSIKDLPAGIKAAIEKESGTGGKVQAFVLGGKAYLVADNIAPGNARAVFMHEVGAHLGIDNLLTKAQYDNLIRKLLSWADKNDGTIESRLARRAVERAGQAQTPDVDLHSEVLAYFVEEAVKAGIDPTAMKYSSEIARWFSELIRAMKQALRKLQMFTAPDLTPQDVVDLAYGAAKIELDTPLGDAAGGALMESRIVRDEQGNREYEGDGVRIAFPQPVDRIEVIPTNGQRVLNYAIMPTDSFGVLGHVDLLVDANGVPESLLDIEVYERGRGAGEKAVAALLNAYPDRNINISNIVPEAQGFWEKLGVPAQNLEEGAAYDGTLNAKILEQAQRDRAQSAARRNAQGGGAANRGADAGAAQGVRGTVQGVTPRIQFSKWSDEIDGIRERIPVGRRAMVSRMFEGAKQLGLGALTNFQLAEQFADKLNMPALKERTGHVISMIQRRGELSQKVTEVAKRWDALKNKAQLNALVTEATMAEIHPDTKDFGVGVNAHLKEADRAKFEALRSRYEALGKEAQDVYQDAKRVLEEQWQARRTAMRRMIDNATAERGAVAMQSGADEATLAKIEAEGKAAVAEYEKQLGRLKGPYFPLLRFGNYLAVSESKALQDAVAALEGLTGDALKKAREQVQAMRKDEKHYSVSAHDTKAEALAAVKASRDAGMAARLSMTDPSAGQLSRESAMLMQQFQDSLRKKWGQGDLDADALNEAIAAMSQVYLANLPEMHALKRQAERKGIAGASTDALRAFASAGQQNAFMASRMEYADALATDMLSIKKQSKAAMAETDSATPGHVANEMLRRHALDMEYRETPVQDWITTLGYTYYLGASPAFLIMNMFQPLMVSVPVLAGRFGFNKSRKAMLDAYGDTLRLLKGARYGDDKKIDMWATIQPGDPDKLDTPGLARAEDRRALRQLMQRGVIDEGLQHELTTYAGDGSRKLAQLQRVVGWTGQQVEIVNRVSTALAAYRLALGDKPARVGKEWTKEHEAAVEYAYAQTIKTQMDYSSESTARLMREGGGIPGAKMVFQFRRFQQGMLYLLMDNIKRAWPKMAGGEGSVEAQKTLGFLFATTGLMAGSLGLPFMGLVLAAMGGDDDDPRGTPETRLKNAIQDWTGGGVLADVLTRGLPAAMGVDISKRIGLGDVASPFPMARLDEAKGTREDAKELLFNAAGPGFGMAANMVDGMRKIAAGDFQLGAEKLLPKMFADLSRMERYATEGMTDSKGNPIATPLTAGDAVKRGLGFGSVTESNYYEGTKALRDLQQGMNDAKGKIGVEYRKAIRSGDFSDVREMIDEWNAKHPRDKITTKQEVEWRRAEVKGKREANAAGIRVDKSAQRYADVARFAQ